MWLTRFDDASTLRPASPGSPLPSTPKTAHARRLGHHNHRRVLLFGFVWWTIVHVMTVIDDKSTVQVSIKRGLRGTPRPPVPSSSLEPLETSEQFLSEQISHPRYGSSEHDSFPSASPAEQSFRHSCWHADRRRVYDALMSTGQPQRRVDAFANCGSALFLSKDGDDLALTSNHCHDRLCQPCQTARRALLVANVIQAITTSKRTVRFLTLTLRARDCLLSDQLARLTACFKELRRRKWWKAHVDGGAMFIECKIGEKSHAWHVHAHCLIEGGYFEQKELSAEWHAVTGDSYIVDVRSVTDPARRAAYVTKYATKPADSTVLRNVDRLQEFILCIKGKRLFQCFGEWKTFSLEGDDEPRRNLTVIGSVENLAARARAGEAEASRFYYAACRKWPHLSQTFGSPAPPPTESPPGTP